MSKVYKIVIERSSCEGKRAVTHCYTPGISEDRPTALDVLLDAQDNEHHDLAYRYGCRNALCGVCTIEVNGKPKLACRTKLRDGDRLSALSTLPVLQDLVVDRAAVNRQLQGRLTVSKPEPVRSSQSTAAFQSLNRCIECYACLDGCPMHKKNSLDHDGNERRPENPSNNLYGNPYALLKIQQLRLDPRSDNVDCDQAMALSEELGLESCVTCKGCRCGVGIDLKKEVIAPLLAARTKPSKEV